MKPIAFVIPWYGDDIRGGAETECNHLAHCLQDLGMNVEVLTTCVREAADDRGVNTLKSGVFHESGITVRRFPVSKRNLERYNQANYKLYHGIAVTEEEEQWYADNDINSPEMYRYISENKEKYHCFIFMPYLYGIIYNGHKQCPDNAVMIPCLHDEQYAYMKLTQQVLEAMKGVIFLSKPEEKLAKSICNLDSEKCAVLGAYVESGWEDECNPMRFREKYNIQDEFILYAGRKDSGKKADELLSFFMRMRQKKEYANLKLVFIGGGTLDIPTEYKNDILDLGFVSLEDKHDAMASALLLCNPSHFESFSLVIMESWLAKRPVLVSEHCAVTKNFCLESNGGLYFSNYQEFEACVKYILEHKEIADGMGYNGYLYVKNNFVHDVIGKKYMDFIKELNM